MGLDVIMLGESALLSLQQDQTEDPEFALLIGFCIKNFPQAASVDIGEPDEEAAQGYRVGSYAALHVLRGLAITVEATDGELEGLREEDFETTAEAFYQNDESITRFAHLIHHSDSDGYYVPFDIAEPIAVEGVPPGQTEQIVLSVGSAPRLLAELDALNAHLQLPGDIGQLGEEAFMILADAHRWPTAAYVWGVLHRYARESAEHFTFIQFC